MALAGGDDNSLPQTAPKDSHIPAISEALLLLAVATALEIAVVWRGNGGRPARAPFHVHLVFASACVAVLAVWARCRRPRTAVPVRTGDEPSDGKEPERRERRAEGGDPDGTAVGATLVPLVLSAFACVSQSSGTVGCPVSSTGSNSTEWCMLLIGDAYAQVVGLLGLAFAVASILQALSRSTETSEYLGRTGCRWSCGLIARENFLVMTAVLFLLLASLLIFMEYLSVEEDRERQTSALLAISLPVCAIQIFMLLLYCLPQHRTMAKRRNRTTKYALMTSVDAMLQRQTHAHNVPSKYDSASERSEYNNGSEAANGRTATSTSANVKPSILSGIFTKGEWIVVSSILSIVLGDFYLRYFRITEAFLPPMLPYLAVSHGGTVGCVVGCAASFFIKNYHLRGIEHDRWGWTVCLAKFLLVVASTVGCVELALGNSCAHHQDLCAAVNEQTLSNISMGRVNFIPSSLIWLGAFLSEQEQMQISPCCSWLQWVGTKMQPRGIWLAYWVVVLTPLIPPAILFAMRLKTIQGRSNQKQCVVVARKFFHFVAVVLFLPPTCLAPSMMALSYAVALSVLILTETLRVSLSNCDSKWQQAESGLEASIKSSHRATQGRLSLSDFYEAFFDEKDVGGKQGGIVVTHWALVCGCASPLWFREILFQHGVPFLDDDASVPGTKRASFIDIMPLIGIISLGVGDAVGALAGTFLGRMRWPGSKRTLEGSVAMLISMALFFVPCSVDCSYFDTTFNASSMLVSLTLLEAFTAQIDNICVPLAGVSVVLVQLLLEN